MEFNYSHIVIRFGELSTKGKNKKDFIAKLLQNIKYKLKQFKNLSYQKNHDRLFINLNNESYQKISDILDNIFGLSSYSVAIKEVLDIEVIKKTALNLIKNESYATFKVETKRQDKSFVMNSDEVNRAVAGYILKNHKIKVDVRKPDVLIKIEIRSDSAYLMVNKIKGLGGFPVGVNGKCLMMISGGIDSPVAAFETMKRGLKIECIHFESSPYTSKEALNKVLDLVKILTKYQSEIIVKVVPFTNIQLAIYKNCPEAYAVTIMRRMMYRIADKIAKDRNILALSNGESVGQVASQTIESAFAIGNVTDRVIYRPLAMFDKIEIIDIAKKIKTFETSILPFDDCCTIFNPKSPITKPKLSDCIYYESKFDYQSLINEAIENQKIYRINDEEDEIF